MPVCLDVFEFGPFRLQPERRLLVAHELPVGLTSRAYDILVFLVENRDRIVTREEIIAQVWRGIKVGDNNLAVQMSALRHVLAKHVDPSCLIANIPGRGYRFVGDVRERAEVATAAAATPDMPATLKASEIPRRRSLTPRWAILMALMGILMATIAISAMQKPVNMTDLRLSMIVEQFTGDTGSAVAVDLARCYTDAVLTHFKLFEDFVLIPQQGGLPAGVQSHFRLRGSVHLDDRQATIVVSVIDMPSNIQVGDGTVSEPIQASAAQRGAAVMDLLSQVRPVIFAYEQKRRQLPAHDAVDLYIDAQNAKNDADTPQALRDVIRTTTRAVAKDPSYRPARVLLSFLLTKSMLWSSATAGDAKGEEALHLIDGALRARKNNSIYLADRAYTLAALGRLDDARAAASRGLEIEPYDYMLRQTFGEIMILLGDLDQAKLYIVNDKDDPTDDTQAFMAFEGEDYKGALDQARAVVIKNTRTWDTGFTMLLEVASLSILGDDRKAGEVLKDALRLLPADFHSISDQRRTYYVLSDRAWLEFKRGLAISGMAS